MRSYPQRIIKDREALTTGSRKDVSDYVQEYLDLGIPKALSFIFAHTPKRSQGGFYDQAISNRLPERLNDASLLLWQVAVSELKDVGKNSDAIQHAAEETHKICAHDGWGTVPRLKKNCEPAISGLYRCVALRQKTKLNVEQASRAFLDLAVAVEMTLGDILEEENMDKEETSQVCLESLTDNMRGLGLGV